MRTNIDIDEFLMAQAMRSSGTRTKRAAVEAGLQLLLKTHAQAGIRRLRGRVNWEGDLHATRLDRQPDARPRDEGLGMVPARDRGK